MELNKGKKKSGTFKVGKIKYTYPACGQTDCFWAYQACTGITCDKIYEAIYKTKAYSFNHPCHSCTYNKEDIIYRLVDNKKKVTKKQIRQTQDIF